MTTREKRIVQWANDNPPPFYEGVCDGFCPICEWDAAQQDFIHSLDRDTVADSDGDDGA